MWRGPTNVVCFCSENCTRDAPEQATTCKGEHAAAVSAPAGGWHEASTGKVVFSAHWPQTARREKQDTFRLFCRGDNSLLPYMQACGVRGRDLGSWNSRVCVSLTANRRVCGGSCRRCVHMCVHARVCDPPTHNQQVGEVVATVRTRACVHASASACTRSPIVVNLV